MPRYFFDIHDDINIIDDKGMVLPDIAAARAQAARALADGAKDMLVTSGSHRDAVIVIRDDAGVVLTARLSFSTEPAF